MHPMNSAESDGSKCGKGMPKHGPNDAEEPQDGVVKYIIFLACWAVVLAGSIECFFRVYADPMYEDTRPLPGPADPSPLQTLISATNALAAAQLNGSAFLITDAAMVQQQAQMAAQAAITVQTMAQASANSRIPAAIVWGNTETSPTSGLSQRTFQEFLVIIWTYITITAGLGTEVLVGTFILRHVPPGWEETVDHLWYMAQFLFPLMMLLSIQLASHQSILALPPLIIGLWKFVFPETFSLLAMATTKKPFRLSWWCDVLNALGTFSHHSSASLFICTIIAGLTPMTREVAAGVMPTVVQHLVVPMKYKCLPLYACLQIVIEAWFEWEVFSCFEKLYGNHGMPRSAHMPYADMDPLTGRAVTGMLVAHWFYWIAALVSGFAMLPGCQEDMVDRGNMDKTASRGTIAQWKDVLSYQHTGSVTSACASMSVYLLKSARIRSSIASSRPLGGTGSQPLMTSQPSVPPSQPSVAPPAERTPAEIEEGTAPLMPKDSVENNNTVRRRPESSKTQTEKADDVEVAVVGDSFTGVPFASV